MITPAEGLQKINGVYCRAETYFGLSTDEKPTAGIGNGSAFVAIDKVGSDDDPWLFFFDAENATWYPNASAAGSLSAPPSLSPSVVRPSGLTLQGVEPAAQPEPVTDDPEEDPGEDQAVIDDA